MFRIYVDYLCGHEYRGFVYKLANGTAEMICEEDAQSSGFRGTPMLFSKEEADTWIANHKTELNGAVVKLM